MKFTRFGLFGILLLLGAYPVLADTFILADGGKLYGQKEKDFEGPDKKPWTIIKSTFGTVSVPQSQIKKVLKAEGDKGTVYLEEILVTFIKGQVERTSDEGKTWAKVSWAVAKPSPEGTIALSYRAPPAINPPNGLIAPGDRVRTNKDSEVDLDVGYGVIHIAPDSEVEFRRAKSATMKVFSGTCASRLEGLPKEQQFQVETPQGVMGVKGTTFLVRIADEATVAVQEGQVQWASQVVKAGEFAQARQEAVKVREGLTPADGKVFERLQRTYSVPRIETVYVPAGEFLMGHPTLAKTQQHKVRVSAYRIGTYHVRMAQYQAFLDYVNATSDHSRCHPREAEAFKSAEYATSHISAVPIPDPKTVNQDGLVSGVCWYDAFGFCAWLGGRLPTEAEWEKAVGLLTCQQGSPAGWYEDWLLDYWDPDFYAKPQAVLPDAFNGAPQKAVGSGDWRYCYRRGPCTVKYAHIREGGYPGTQRASSLTFRICFPVVAESGGK